jgi:hypothetical protein
MTRQQLEDRLADRRDYWKGLNHRKDTLGRNIEILAREIEELERQMAATELPQPTPPTGTP